MISLFMVVRSIICTVPVNHEASAIFWADRPTANGYSSSTPVPCMRRRSVTAPVAMSIWRNENTSATNSEPPSTFRPAGTASLPRVRVRTAPVSGLTA